MKLDQLKLTAQELQDIKNGVGNHSNEARMAALIALSKLNKVINLLKEESQ